MIIFDLDGTLADCSHRQHFVDALKLTYPWKVKSNINNTKYDAWCEKTGDRWKPDWLSFHESCSEDKPIFPVIQLFWALREEGHQIEIWSGRCNSVRQKTIDWLEQHIDDYENWDKVLKMRPIGDYTPDDQLKERWLDEAITEGKTISCVFDDRPKVVRMWRKKGIFVFDVYQGNGDF